MHSIFSRHRRAIHGSARRGVLILVVLSLLSLFLMIGVAYVLTTGQFHSTSQRRSTARNFMADPQETIDAGMYHLLRDTRNDRSAIRYHSLLNDFYGNDGFTGTIGTAAATTGTGGAFIDIVVPAANVISATDGRPHVLSTTLGAYAGCIFTVVSGTEVGRSARIMGYNGVDTLTVMNWETRNGRSAIPGNLNGAKFVVNGRPFNGMGAGYNFSTGKCDLLEVPGGSPSALLPNRSVRVSGTVPTTGLGYNWGGCDESYDAPDFQNMFLASIPLGSGLIGNDYTDLQRLPLPSFHRPDLYKYWSSRGTPPRCLMRPMHGGFSGELWMPPLPWSAASGTNLNIRYSNGPWDVDNDGDTIPDSVWVDLGFPDATSPDGYIYRPLFAFLVVDLDGRLNLNANGNSAHYDSSLNPATINLAGGVNSTNARNSEGIGPAEVMLNGGLTAPVLTPAEYQAILEGNASYQGRYGNNSDARPGVAGQIDKAAWWYSQFGMPANFYTDGIFTTSLLGRPLNLRGQLAFGLDSRGVPAYEVTSVTDERIDNPYEINLSLKASHGAIDLAVDAPYSVNEMESLLRPFDRDTPGLPSRLNQLAPNLAKARRMYTTASFSVPAAYNSLPKATRLSNGGAPYASLVHFLSARLVAGGLSTTAANAEIVKMLAPEVIRGERLNLNRLFGNGLDDNSNNVIDDDAEAGETIAYPTAGSPVNVTVDYTNGAPNMPNSPMGARQLLARHLYCLMMLIKYPTSTSPADSTLHLDFDGNPGNNSFAETAKGLAQWAVNVVDFRDPDAIMTPFEYDPNPFNGWAPDGDLASTGESERGVVWGLERPELLISETLAWHDRATEDRNDDPTMKNRASSPPDPDFDQRYRPKGAAFIELHNPWPGQDKYPAEFYSNVSGNPALNLNKLSAQGNSPVWRLLVVQGASRESKTTTSPLYYDPESINTSDIERSIYFSNNFSSITGHGVPYYPSDSSLLSPIYPGGYGVVGSAGRLIGGQYVSTIGHTTGDTNGTDANVASTRRVVLAPATGQVSVLSNNSGNPVAATSTAAAIAIDSPRSFSVSEPDGTVETYYANSVPDRTNPATMSTYSTVAGSESKYTPPIDAPLDAARAAADSRWAPLMQDGTVQDFRTIHLQRLANPLMAWHATTNPYITIDVSSMNLTAFNGAETTGTADPSLGTPALPSTFTTSAAHLATFQRGKGDVANARTLWRHESTMTQPTALGTDGTHIRGRVLRHSLGYLNEAYGSYGSNYPVDTGSTTTNMTFPWLTWHNRPYIGTMDLLLVPRSKPSRLAFDYTALLTATPVANYNLPANYLAEAGTYGHLLNFFDARVTGGAHLYRLLDYVGVPSKFAGTSEVLDPATFGLNSAPAGVRVPNNLISTMREPGRININTINDERVWNALMCEYTGIEWFQIIACRRGYGPIASGTPMWLDNSASPTYFSNPFRGNAAGELVPLAGFEKIDIEASMLRSYPLTPPVIPTFHSNSSQIAGAIQPNGSASATPPIALMRPDFSNKFDQADRNPYFRYKLMNRLNNLVTTQSNVYAVWVTMAYFQSNNDSQALQDELWKEEGNPERHRAFYIIDRSIPVAFEPGENHNVDDAILVRRMLD